MSSILQKLQTLQDRLAQLTDRHHIVSTELANLKNKPNNDAKNEAIIHALKHELSEAKEHIKKLTQSLDDGFAQIQRYDEQNHTLTKQNEKLQQTLAQLQEKNRLAAERAETIKNWLINIDNKSV